jgi:hypothetical protein
VPPCACWLLQLASTQARQLSTESGEDTTAARCPLSMQCAEVGFMVSFLAALNPASAAISSSRTDKTCSWQFWEHSYGMWCQIESTAHCAGSVVAPAAACCNVQCGLCSDWKLRYYCLQLETRSIDAEQQSSSCQQQSCWQHVVNMRVWHAEQVQSRIDAAAAVKLALGGVSSA